MKRCASKTKSGHRCLNRPMSGGDFCSVHRAEVSGREAVAVGVGAVVGHVLAPGLGGVVLGGLAGKLVRSLLRDGTMAKTRVFVSFDFDNDRVLKDFILGQAKLADSPFDVVDHSLKEAAPEHDWERKARAAIGRSEIVLVMVGAQTHRAQGVLEEVAMARQAGVKVVQIIGYKSGDYTPVPNAGRPYAWSWENLKKLLS
jgi:hypothetical protein